MGVGSVAERVDLGTDRSAEVRMGFKVAGFAKRLKWVCSEAELMKRDVWILDS